MGTKVIFTGLKKSLKKRAVFFFPSACETQPVNILVFSGGFPKQQKSLLEFLFFFFFCDVVKIALLFLIILEHVAHTVYLA